MIYQQKCNTAVRYVFGRCKGKPQQDVTNDARVRAVFVRVRVVFYSRQ